MNLRDQPQQATTVSQGGRENANAPPRIMASSAGLAGTRYMIATLSVATDLHHPDRAPNVMTRASAAPSVSLVATSELTENLRTFPPERSRHCAREARTCAGRGVDAPASSSSISGGLRNQRFETHYRSVRLTGKKVNQPREVWFKPTSSTPPYPGTAPVHRTREEPGSVQERRERPRRGGRKSLPPDGSEIFCRVFPRCDFFLRTQVQPGAGTPGSNPGVVPPPGLSWVLAQA